MASLERKSGLPDRIRTAVVESLRLARFSVLFILGVEGGYTIGSFPFDWSWYKWMLRGLREDSQ